MNPIALTISERASHYIKTMIEKQQGLGFRLSIKKTGCSGFSYAPEIVSGPQPNDLQVEQVEFPVFIDSKWTNLFQGLYVDYIEEEKSGLKQKRLIFINPNEASRCGCGESFHLE